MREVFSFGSNKLVIVNEDDGALTESFKGIITLNSFNNIYSAIGMAFHYTQQQFGQVFLNGREIVALSFIQTCGARAIPLDFVGVIDFGDDQYKYLNPTLCRLGSIIKGPTRLSGYRNI